MHVSLTPNRSEERPSYVIIQKNISNIRSQRTSQENFDQNEFSLYIEDSYETFHVKYTVFTVSGLL